MKIKKNVKRLLLIIVAIVMIGCINPIKVNATNTRKLNATELKEIEEYINKVENNNILYSYFTSADQINVLLAMRDGAGFYKGDNLEGEEYKALASMYNMDDLPTDVIKLTTENIKSWYKEKTDADISTEEIKKQFKNWKYIEKYDAYYNMHGDTLCRTLNVVQGVLTSDGLYVVEYKPGQAYSDSLRIDGLEEEQTSMVVTLQKKNDSYVFKKNQLTKDVDFSIQSIEEPEESEVEKFDKLLKSKDYAGFLLSIYSNPEEIDINPLAYYTAEGNLPEDELTAYRGSLRAGNDYKITISKMEEFFKKMTGTTLANTAERFITWKYVKQYDAYYANKGNPDSISKCISVSNDGDIYKVTYECENYDNCEVYEIDEDYWYGVDKLTLTLKKIGDSYEVVSNEVASEGKILSKNRMGEIATTMINTYSTTEDAYKAVLEATKKDKSIGKYTLTDINDDGKYELVVEAGIMESRIKAYYYGFDQGKIIDMGIYSLDESNKKLSNQKLNYSKYDDYALLSTYNLNSKDDTTKADKDMPKTGEQIAIIIGMVVVSLFVIIISIVVNRKRVANKKEN